MKNNIPTILLRISLVVLIASISLSIAKAMPGSGESEHSNLIGKTCILQTGTGIIVVLAGKFFPVSIGNTYAVKVAKVKKWTHPDLWFAIVKFDTDLVRIIAPQSKLPKYISILVAGVAIQELGGCK